MMIEILIMGACTMLGLGIMGTGAYLWLAAKKVIAGIILLAFGLILTLIPIALTTYLITISARGSAQLFADFVSFTFLH